MIVSRKFMDRVMEEIERNRALVMALEGQYLDIHAQAHEVLERALEEWIDRADPDVIKKVFGIEEIEGIKEEVRRKAREKLKDMGWYEIEQICKELRYADDKINEAFEEFSRLEQRAIELERTLKPIIENIMPIDKGKIIRVENLVKMMVVVYKICRELEKQGLEP